MYPDPLSFSRIPVEPAKPAQSANRSEGEMAFAVLYAEQMQTVKEIGQLSSGDPSATADSAASSSADDLLALLQLQAGWNSNACEAENPLNVPGEANGQPGDIHPLQGRNAAKLYSGEAAPASQSVQSNPSSQPEENAHSPSGLHRLISWLDSHAHLHSTHHCAASVRQAMEAAGIQTAGRPGDAGDYGPFLLRHGARAVDSESYQPQAGDFAVFDKTDDHPAGHIQVFNGQHWVSDFVQHSFSPYRDRQSTPAVTVYRLS